MARIRTVKPEFWTHEDLSALPEATHMLAAALLNYADDEGYFNANPGLIKAACCPLREPSVSVHDSLNLLAQAGYIRLGDGPDGKRYGQVVTFNEHQRVNRPTPSKIKALNVLWDESVTAHTQITESSSPERNREQGREEEKNSCAALLSPIKPAKASSSGNPKPEEIFPDVPKDILRDYMAIRKLRRAPLTKTAADILKSEARKAGINDADMLRTCCENNWLGFKASWMNGDKPRRAEDAPPARTFREVSL